MRPIRVINIFFGFYSLKGAETEYTLYTMGNGLASVDLVKLFKD